MIFKAVYCCNFFCFDCLADWHIFRGEVKHGKRDKSVFVVARIFTIYFSFSVKAFFRNKEELSNWFSPRVVGGFSRVTLTKNHCVIFCVWRSLFSCVLFLQFQQVQKSPNLCFQKF